MANGLPEADPAKPVDLAPHLIRHDRRFQALSGRLELRLISDYFISSGWAAHDLFLLTPKVYHAHPVREIARSSRGD